ncbi:hypothetical protein MMC13_001102 [Lambiella insularis]|nr:hypothetical protein [Lambiella insularis]
MSQAAAQVLAPTPSSSRKRQSSSIEAPPPKHRRVTKSSRKHSIIEDWLSITDSKVLEPLTEEEAISTPRPGLAAGEGFELDEEHKQEIGGPQQSCRSPEPAPVQQLTKEALNQLKRENMAATAEPSELSTSKVSNITPYNFDFNYHLQARGILFAGSDIRPSNLSELEQALATTNSITDFDEYTLDLFRCVQELYGAEVDVTAKMFDKLLPISDAVAEGGVGAFADNQSWDTGTLVQNELQPALAVPKPDRAYGWKSGLFPFKSTEHLGCIMRPVPQQPHMSWPYITAELKGESGSLRVANLQNLHNGAVMLNNLLQLKRAVGKEEEFYNNIHVLSVQFTTETITLSCYWTTRGEEEEIRFHGYRVKSWLVEDGQAKPAILNVIKWLKKRNFEWIMKDMQDLEKKLNNPSHGITPPPSRSGRGTGIKRRGSQSLSRGRSASSLRHSVSGEPVIPGQPPLFSDNAEDLANTR